MTSQPIELTVNQNGTILVNVIQYVDRPEELPFFNLAGIIDGNLLAWDSPSQKIVPASGSASVSLVMPASVFNVETVGSTINVTFDNQNANYVFAGPATGLLGTPTFRQLVVNDIASLFADSGTIDFTSGSTIAASVKTNSITEAMLAFDVATQAELNLKQPLSQRLTEIADIAGAAVEDLIYWTGSSWSSIDVASLGLTNASNLNIGTLPNARISGLPLANLANQPSLTVVGNNTGMSAVPIALTMAQVKTMLALDVSDISGSDDASNLTTGTLPNARISSLPLANLANQPGLTIVGNNAGSTASPAALTAIQAKSLLAITSSDVSDLGTAAVRNVPTAGNASPAQVVLGDDSRLIDNRIPPNFFASSRPSGGAFLRVSTTDDFSIVLSPGSAVINKVLYTWVSNLTFTGSYATTSDHYAYLSAPDGIPTLELSSVAPTLSLSDYYYCKAGDVNTRLMGVFKIAFNGTANVVLGANHTLGTRGAYNSVTTLHLPQTRVLTYGDGSFLAGNLAGSATNWTKINVVGLVPNHTEEVIIRLTSTASNATSPGLVGLSGYPLSNSVAIGDQSNIAFSTPSSAANTLLTRGATVSLIDGSTPLGVYLRVTRTAGTGTISVNAFCIGGTYII